METNYLILQNIVRPRVVIMLRVFALFRLGRAGRKPGASFIHIAIRHWTDAFTPGTAPGGARCRQSRAGPGGSHRSCCHSSQLAHEPVRRLDHASAKPKRRVRLISPCSPRHRIYLKGHAYAMHALGSTAREKGALRTRRTAHVRMTSLQC